MGDLKLNVSTAAVTVPIYDMDADGNEIKIGAFRFNPSDIDIVRRYEDVIKVLEALNVPENAGVEEILKISDGLKEQINYLLGYNVADDIFKVCNPLTPTGDGDFFIEVVLNGIADIVEQESTARIKKKEAKIRRATAKYTKK